MKGVVFVIFLFFFILPVGFFLSLLFKGLKGAKKDEWEGEVSDKLYNTRRDSENPHRVNEFYSIVFKTNKGERKIAVNKADYPNWKVGDKARKIKNKFGVEKL
jgi:hypothetical protein